jgi:hypothetical protein
MCRSGERDQSHHGDDGDQYRFIPFSTSHRLHVRVSFEPRDSLIPHRPKYLQHLPSGNHTPRQLDSRRHADCSTGAKLFASGEYTDSCAIAIRLQTPPDISASHRAVHQMAKPDSRHIRSSPPILSCPLLPRRVEQARAQE